MAMVSENQSGNLKGSPLQFLQLPTRIVTENNVKKNLKIKIPLKRIEAEPRTESCKTGQKVVTNDECAHSIPAYKNKKSEMTKSLKIVLPSSGDRKLYADPDKLSAKSSSMGSLKRELPGAKDVQNEKRRKMDRSAMRQCSSVLRQLRAHPAAWVFKEPVDPVKLNIPDYHSIISHPMDLGTIEKKLDKNKYSSVEEFAADVRLTFSNAMLYNPPSSQVYPMAEQLNNVFKTRWNCLEARWNCEQTNVDQGSISSIRAKDTNNPGQKESPLHVSLLPELSISAEEKQKLRKQLLELSREKMPQHLEGFLKRHDFNWQREGRMEVNLDAFDDETLRALKRIVRSSLGANAAKAASAKKTANGRRQSLGSIVHRGTDSGNRSDSGSANVNLPSNVVAPKCGSCGTMRCQCSLHSDAACASSSDLSSERSLEQSHIDASSKNGVESVLVSQMSKSDPESDGAISALDDEHICSSPQLSTLATTATSEEGLTPLIDIQLSPKKALRAAMLKTRFADTIFKAKQKTLLDHVDKVNPVKMQKEKERLERQQRKEKARIEAQIKAAEAASRMKAEAELKMQREREREAARLELQKIEKTVEIEDNLEILKDLEMLSGSSLSEGGSIEGFNFGNPLERLGLFMKDEYIADENEDAILDGAGEEGEIY